ncbi:MAG: DUF805 domain-containing protein [bacterium]
MTVRYRFVAAELRAPVPVRVGDAVDFVPVGDEARQVFVLASAAAVADGMAAAPTDRSLWGWFVHVLTMRGGWKGRARRKEYWAFSLFACVVLLVACLPLAAYDDDGGDWVLFLPLIVLALAMVPAGLKVSIRRLHDVGLSGWCYLINFVPWLGSLFSLVVALIPSQSRSNRWGPPAAPR